MHCKDGTSFNDMSSVIRIGESGFLLILELNDDIVVSQLAIMTIKMGVIDLQNLIN